LDGAEEAKVPDLPPDVIQRISNPDVYREEGTQREAVYLNGGSFEIKKTQCWHSGSDDAKAGWYWLNDYVKINDVKEFAFNLAKTLGHITPSSATEMYGMTYEQYIQNAQFKLLELSKKYNYSDTFFKIIGDNYKDFITGYQKYHGEAIQEVSMLDIVLATTGVAQIVKGAFQYAIKQAINRTITKNITTVTTENIIVAETGTALATKYPTIEAIAGTTEREFLMPGKIIDRFGPLEGKWFSTPGTSYGARSIPPGLSPYIQFEVLKPFEIERSIASPGFFSIQTGFGIQFRSPVGADILIKRGIIKTF
jgi:hypothetical protein